MNTIVSTKSTVMFGQYGLYIVFHGANDRDYTMSAKNYLIGLKKVNTKAQIVFKDVNELNEKQLRCSLLHFCATLKVVDNRVYLTRFTSKWL